MTGGRTATDDRVLLADIGGTNARFALMDRGEIGPVEHLKVADFSGTTDAIAAFLDRHPDQPATAGAFGVAGPVQNNRCIITNSRWVIDGDELQKMFSFSTARVLNDFEALAWSLPALQPSDLFPLGKQRPIAGAPMLAIGPGTGFGAACFYRHDTRPFAAVTEAGHATLPATSEREEQVIGQLRRHLGHVSIERGALSGSGLENLYSALAAVDGVAVPDRDPAAITSAALDGSCSISRAALDMFCSLLGSVAGNLALTFCAQGGVFIAGGIVPRFADRLVESNFRTQFESKGRYQSYLRDIPIHIIVNPDASFIGLKAFFESQAPARASVPIESERRL